MGPAIAAEGDGELVFLDSNVLFSAALGGSTFVRYLRLAEAGTLRLVSTSGCVAEAVTNLERKRPGSVGGFAEVLLRISIEHPDVSPHFDAAERLVGTDDAHVLAAAWELGVAVLVTGDRKDFGHLMDRADLRLRVRTPAAFLTERVPRRG